MVGAAQEMLANGDIKAATLLVVASRRRGSDATRGSGMLRVSIVRRCGN